MAKKRASLDQQALIQLPDGDEYLARIRDVHGPRICLQAPPLSNLHLGVFFPVVHCFVEGRCCFRGRGQVLTLTEDQDEAKRPFSDLWIEIFISDPQGGGPSVRCYDNASVIDQVIRNLQTVSASVQLRGSWDEGIDQAISGIVSGVDPGNKTLMVGLESIHRALKSGANTTLETELYGTRLALVARVRRRRGFDVTLEWPTQIELWGARKSSRLRLPTSELEVRFELPLFGRFQSRPVVDVSASGLSFLAAPRDGLVSGMMLKDLTLRLPGHTIEGTAVVRHVRQENEEEIFIGAEFDFLKGKGAEHVAEYVDQHVHPQVRPVKGTDLPGLWEVYNAMEAFEQQIAALTPLIHRIEHTRSLLLTRGKDFFEQMVGVEHQLVNGSAEAIQLYPNTWRLQHIGVTSTAPVSVERILSPLLERLLRKKSFQYAHFLIPSRSMHKWLETLRTLGSDPKKLTWSEKVLLAPKSDYVPLSREDISEARDSNLNWVVSKLRQRHSLVMCQGLGFLGAEPLRMPRVERFYRGLGLLRERSVRIAIAVTGPIGFSLIEQGSPGLSLGYSGDLVRLYAVEAGASAQRAAFRALADDALRFSRAGHRPDPVFLLDPDDAAKLADVPFEDRGYCTELIATREMVERMWGLLNLS